jgi:hypothetical protein
MDPIITAYNPGGTCKDIKIKSPGTRSPGIFAPIWTRTRCQDPGQLFIYGHGGNGHRGPPATPGKHKPAHYRPVIFASCLCKAFRGPTRRFMLYWYVYPSKAQNAPQRPPQDTRGTRRHTRPPARRDQPGPATGCRGGTGQGTPGKWQRRRKGKRAARARKSPDPRKGEPG